MTELGQKIIDLRNSGYTMIEIKDKLGCSISTVSMHARDIVVKTKINSKPLHEKYSDQEIIELARHSSSISDFCRKMGYNSTSVYPEIKKRLDLLGGVEVKRLSKYKITDKKIIKAAKSSKSVSELLRKVGMKAGSGYARTRFKTRLSSLGIEFANNSTWHRGKTAPRRKVEEYLTLNGLLITSTTLRRRLLNAGLKKAICEMCGLSNVWNKKKLVHHLDHINGNSLDNRFENLRILCPNCHTQTPTYGKMKPKISI